MNNRNLLLQIVQTWNIKQKPEYRDFKCAVCQKYIRKAFYYLLNYGGYKTFLHFCKKCQKKINSEKIKIKKPEIKFNRKKFGLQFEKEFTSFCKKIVQKWQNKKTPIYQSFICEKCKKSIIKAYHIWINLSGALSEIHLCKNCGNKLKLKQNDKGIF